MALLEKKLHWGKKVNLIFHALVKWHMYIRQLQYCFLFLNFLNQTFWPLRSFSMSPLSPLCRLYRKIYNAVALKNIIAITVMMIVGGCV